MCSIVVFARRALYHGLNLALKFGVLRLLIESDSMVACELLQRHNVTTHHDYYLVDRC